jgi:hypothetical protein
MAKNVPGSDAAYEEEEERRKYARSASLWSGITDACSTAIGTRGEWTQQTQKITPDSHTALRGTLRLRNSCANVGVPLRVRTTATATYCQHRHYISTVTHK